MGDYQTHSKCDRPVNRLLTATGALKRLRGYPIHCVTESLEIISRIRQGLFQYDKGSLGVRHPTKAFEHYCVADCATKPLTSLV